MIINNFTRSMSIAKTAADVASELKNKQLFHFNEVHAVPSVSHGVKFPVA
jgi:hypothetical protein